VVAICNQARARSCAIKIAPARSGFHKSAFLHTQELQKVKISARKNFGRCDPWFEASAKRKSPALPGF